MPTGRGGQGWGWGWDRGWGPPSCLPADPQHPRSCLVKVTGELTMSFPAGIVRVFSGSLAPPVLSFRLLNAGAIEQFLPNAELLYRCGDTGTWAGVVAVGSLGRTGCWGVWFLRRPQALSSPAGCSAAPWGAGSLRVPAVGRPSVAAVSPSPQ